jgi:hemerythrin superfamily protein
MEKIFDASDEDALDLLKNDHREVRGAIAEFNELKEDDSARKKELAGYITAELLKHMTVEEEIFYPAVKDAIEDAEDVVKESVIEHAVARGLIKQIQDGSGGDEFFEAEIKVLGELIEHHVKEEEEEMFPKVKKSSLDLAALGREIAARKADL